MGKKSKPRYDYGGAFQIPRYEQLTENEIQDIFGEEFPADKNNELIRTIYKLTEIHLGCSVGLDTTCFPTTGEYRATFEDLIDTLKNVEIKLNALNEFAYSIKTDEPLSSLTKKPPNALINETVANLNLIKQATIFALDDIKVTSGRRKNIYDHVTFFVDIATAYEKYTETIPRSTCEETGYGKYAQLILKCCEKSHIKVTTDFCNQIRKAVKEYKKRRNTP